MRQLLDLLKKYGLAKNEIKKLEDLTYSFRNKYLYRRDRYASLSDEDKARLREVIVRIDATISKELEIRTLTELDLSGTLNYSELIHTGISSLFSSKEVVNKLPNIIKNDLDEGLWALIYNIPTASAMISLRAVEGSIRWLWKALKGSECKKGWKDALEEVEKELKGKKLSTKELEGYLSHFRNIRNESEHPERIFTRKEAERLLNNCVYAIEEIAKIIEMLENGEINREMDNQTLNGMQDLKEV